MSDVSFPTLKGLEQISPPTHHFIAWKCPLCHVQNVVKVELGQDTSADKCMGCGAKYNVYFNWHHFSSKTKEGVNE